MKVLYLTRDDGRDVRATKVCNSLARLGHDVVFVGWDRTPHQPKEIHLAPTVRRRILSRPGVFEKNSFEGWRDYVPHVIRSLREERPAVVQAVNEDAAVMVLPFKRVLYRHLFIDVYDSVIANRYRTAWLNAAARLSRWLGNAGADRIIETSPKLQTMLGRFARKSIIVENAPADPGPELAAQLPGEGPVRIAVGGGLNERRMGLRWLVQALDRLPAGSVVVEATGRLQDEYAKETFGKHPAVRYRWLPSPRDFLDVAATCDALLYLRTDAHESAYRAAVLPNRVFDALAVGRPLIVNDGLTIAPWIRDEGLGQVVPDGDASALAEAIGRCSAARSQLSATAARLRKLFLSGHTWPVMEERLAQCYRELIEHPSCRLNSL